MAFSSRILLGRGSNKPQASAPPPLSSNAWRIGVVITALVGLILLIDQQLETVFDAAEITEIDKSTYRITTTLGTFLGEYPNDVSVVLQRGDLLEMEFSPITKTVVAYRPFETIMVESPRETIFSYWPITLIMTLVSLFLLFKWKTIHLKIELLMLNLILLVIVSILYFVSH